MESTTYTVGGKAYTVRHGSTELMHYGVKGMKWGIRKARQKSRELDDKKAAYTRAMKDDTKSYQEARSAKRTYKAAKKEWRQNAPTKAKLERGAAQTVKALAKVGSMYATDQIFFGGIGTRVVKEAIKVVGMTTITAYTAARGGYDIHWFDKYGRKIV